jgi:hypothetical protein
MGASIFNKIGRAVVERSRKCHDLATNFPKWLIDLTPRKGGSSRYGRRVTRGMRARFVRQHGDDRRVASCSLNEVRGSNAL